MLTIEELRGVYVPIVTPFDAVSEELALSDFRRQLAALLAAGVDGLVINGTTGESPTVSQAEVALLLAEAQSAVAAAAAAQRAERSTQTAQAAQAVQAGQDAQGAQAGQDAQGAQAVQAEQGAQMAQTAQTTQHTGSAIRPVPIVVGTGTNDTAETVRRTARAAELGADAALVVTPYYNRPSPAGVVAHFRRVAEVGLPVIVYEIPHRTGLALPVDTIREILELEGVVGIKDSTPGVQLVTELSRLGSKPVLCGEDSQWFAALCCGAAGGMLASANVRTAQFVGLFRSFAAGQTAEAKRAFDELLPLIRLLFAEPNPGPLKWLLAREGVIGSDAMRLPMTGISARLQAELAAQRV